MTFVLTRHSQKQSSMLPAPKGSFLLHQHEVQATPSASLNRWDAEKPTSQSYPELSGTAKAPWCFSARSMSSSKAELMWLFQGFLRQSAQGRVGIEQETEQNFHPPATLQGLVTDHPHTGACLFVSQSSHDLICKHWYSTYLEHLPKSTFTVISAAFLFHPWLQKIMMKKQA